MVALEFLGLPLIMFLFYAVYRFDRNDAERSALYLKEVCRQENERMIRRYINGKQKAPN